MSRDFLNWCAGFYEGEGSCGFYKEKKRGTTRLVVGITQKERKVLDDIMDFFGAGSVCKIRENKPGEVHVFHISGHGASKFLEAILPYMRSTYKIGQVKKALLGWNNRKTKNEKTI